MKTIFLLGVSNRMLKFYLMFNSEAHWNLESVERTYKLPVFNQSINVYSFQQPHLIFQEKKAFAVATLVVSQAPKSVNMHRNFELSYIGLCDKLSISTTTLGVNSWKLTITTTSAIWTKRGTGNIVWRNLGLEGKLSELSWFPASSRWEENISQWFMMVGCWITVTDGVRGSDWLWGCGRGNRSRSCRTTFLFQEFFSASGISSEGGWAGLLFLLAVHGQGHLRPGERRRRWNQCWGRSWFPSPGWSALGRNPSTWWPKRS